MAKGIIPVAAAGNEFLEGNPLEFPASLPHVVTVAATTRDDQSAVFSNANDAIDLSAPGVGIMTAVPPALDTDGAQDGYQAARRHELLGADGLGRAGLGARRAAGAGARPRRPGRAARRRATSCGPAGTRSPATASWTSGNALAVAEDRLPIHDPLEPNDNLVWVDGRRAAAPEADLVGRAA